MIRPTMHLPDRPRGLVCAALTCFLLLALPAAHAKGPASLEGVWKEVDDEATTSVLQFEQSGAVWTGSYLQVSANQAAAGFHVGEAIIRGQLVGSAFTGQVLLKNVDANPDCPTVGLGWTPVRMELVQNRQRLHGSFMGTVVQEDNECKVTGRYWRPYRLKRVSPAGPSTPSGTATPAKAG